MIVGFVGVAIYNNTVSSTITESSQSTMETTPETFEMTTLDGTAVTVTYTTAERDVVEMIIGDENYTLTSAVSGSGARYTNDDESVEYWEHQGGAMIMVNGQDFEVAAIDTMDQDTGTIEPSEINSISAQEHPELLANMWQWQTTQYNNDTEIMPLDTDAFVASFNDEGQFSSSTDCNQTFGSYEVGSNNSLSFGPLASTLMFCENSQEMEYGNMLSEITSYMIAENGNLVLMLKYDSGSMIFIPIIDSIN